MFLVSVIAVFPMSQYLIHRIWGPVPICNIEQKSECGCSDLGEVGEPEASLCREALAKFEGQKPVVFVGGFVCL